MSQNKTSKYRTHTFDGFGGLDRGYQHTDPSVAEDVVNFRIRKDGSLEKRNGYSLLSSIGLTIRAFHSFIEDGVRLGYVLAKNTVYSINLTTGEASVVDRIGSFSGPACFFYCHGILYLTDGNELYEFKNGAFTVAGGYVPLIGRDWPNNYTGPTYERKNIVTRRVRINYRVSTEKPSIFMVVGEPIESVQAVYVDGVLKPADEYYIDEEFQSVNVLGMRGGESVTIHITLKNWLTSLRTQFLSVTQSMLFGDTTNDRLFFWGGSDRTTMFCTSFVERENLEQSALHNSSANEIYIPEGGQFQVGEGRQDIQGVACPYDRMMIFTEGETWIAKSDATAINGLSFLRVNNTIGCAAFGGVTLMGSTPVTIGRGTIYRWDQVGENVNSCEPVRISEKIDPLLSTSDYLNSGLYYNAYENELWLHNRVTGNIWICNMSNQTWFRFTGIVADRFFATDGTVGFLRTDKLYIMKKSTKVDKDSTTGGTAIVASYVTQPLDFGTDAYKNLSAMVLKADLGGGAVQVSFEGDGIGAVTRTLSAPDGFTHSVLPIRAPSARFRKGRVRITTLDNTKVILHSLTLNTR